MTSRNGNSLFVSTWLETESMATKPLDMFRRQKARPIPCIVQLNCSRESWTTITSTLPVVTVRSMVYDARHCVTSFRSRMSIGSVTNSVFDSAFQLPQVGTSVSRPRLPHQSQSCSWVSHSFVQLFSVCLSKLVHGIVCGCSVLAMTVIVDVWLLVSCLWYAWPNIFLSWETWFANIFAVSTSRLK